jgi:hypothetical protein
MAGEPGPQMQGARAVADKPFGVAQVRTVRIHRDPRELRRAMAKRRRIRWRIAHT